ncbi:MAG TPA: hypothetical protein VH083_05965 [Myxococcales bacterium]|jgi:hypothetical protein|nr:hypothetical protein [Myxococcales bacterium]
MPALRTVALSTLLLLAACAKTDAGAACSLQDGNGANLTAVPGRQYLFLGSSECQSFACLSTGSGAAYCSQACTGDGASCPAGLVCQELAIDQEYLATVQARITPEQFQQTFGQMTSSFYCVRAQ